MGSKASYLRANRRYLFIVGLIVLAVYVLLPQMGDLRSSWNLLRHSESSWVVVAIGLTSLTYLAAAGTYRFLALKPLHYGQLVLVQVAAMFMNKLLPAGIGAAGANYGYLRHKGHDEAQAASTVATNNLIGFIGHVIVVAVACLAFSGQLMPGRLWHGWSPGQLIGVVVLTVALLAALDLAFGQKRLARSLINLRTQLIKQSSRPWHLLGALCTSICLTLANVLCLVACALALGVRLPFVAVLIVFSFGAGAGEATPTPGGLGGFETGLFAGFVAYHVAAPAALAVALLYRFVSLWLPLVAGVAAFIVCQKRRLFSV